MSILKKLVVVSVGLLCSSVAFAAPSDESYSRGLAEYNKSNYVEAKAMWEWSAEQGNPSAKYALGNLYSNGQGVGQNIEKAKDYYLSSGDANSLYALGVIYSEGKAGSKVDKTKAKQYFKEACNKNIANACQLIK